MASSLLPAGVGGRGSGLAFAGHGFHGSTRPGRAARIPTPGGGEGCGGSGDLLHVDPATENVGDPLSVRREGGSTGRDVLAGIGDSRHIWSEQARLFLFIGLLGGFTTFSSISYDTLAMLRASNYVGALGNVGLSLALGLTAVAVGYVAGKSGG